MSYLILVVLYEKSFTQSESISSILKSLIYLQSSTIIIWDNSSKSKDASQVGKLKKITAGLDVIYKHTPENKHLSEIYNSFVNLSPRKHDFIVLLDHDTVFDSQLFKAHQQAINAERNSNLYLPVVKFKNSIVSPGKQIFFKSLPYKDLGPGLMSSKRNTAINSGMIIRWSYFNDKFKGYDERLKFYGTDDYFMMEYRKTNETFYLLDYSINHDLTCNPDSDNIYKFKSSFHESQKAFLILHGNGRALSIAGLVVFMRRLKHTLKFRINFFTD
ncbi:glycosyltransferase [Pseudomonas piscis]|uniref:glycosyltransferase n=1 Tax=Pseudomonas piscis TaxID=2614538 RepID=UPI0038512A4A